MSKKEQERDSTVEKPSGIRMVVTARVGNPLLDALPEMLRVADPNVPIEVIFVIPDGFRKDTQSQEALRRVIELLKNRTSPSLKTFPSPEMGEDDLENLVLELKSPSNQNNLAVFIQDPKDPGQYWFRKIGIKQGVSREGEVERPYIDVEMYDLGGFNKIPIPEKDLTMRLDKVLEGERMLSLSEDPGMKALQASVGVARYRGTDYLTLESILNLAAIKYLQMKTSQQD